MAEHIKADEGAAAHMGLNSLLFGILLLILGVLYF